MDSQAELLMSRTRTAHHHQISCGKARTTAQTERDHLDQAVHSGIYHQITMHTFTTNSSQTLIKIMMAVWATI